MVLVNVNDEVVARVGGRFKLCSIIQRRLVELMGGAPPLVARNGQSDLELAIAELVAGLLAERIDGSAWSPTPPRLHDALQAYHQEQEALLRDAPGKYVAYDGPNRLGVFDTREDALSAGYARTRLASSFLVRRIEADDSTETSTWQLGRSFAP
jgi:DNA-directed RNA polymerase subunit omega